MEAFSRGEIKNCAKAAAKRQEVGGALQQTEGGVGPKERQVFLTNRERGDRPNNQGGLPDQQGKRWATKKEGEPRRRWRDRPTEKGARERPEKKKQEQKKEGGKKKNRKKEKKVKKRQREMFFLVFFSFVSFL